MDLFLTLAAVESAIRSSWSLETCDPVDVQLWSPENPSRGQCGATALVVHELIGGDLLEAEVAFRDGGRQGQHYWNRLAGLDLDLTRDQFTEGEVVHEPRVVAGPLQLPTNNVDQYILLRSKVRAALGLAESPTPY